MASDQAFPNFLTGEIAGTVTATQLPDIACSKVNLKAVSDNSGNVYLGGDGVTKPNGSNDETTGFCLDAGEETGWIEVDNLNKLYRICDNAGDDLVYIALR